MSAQDIHRQRMTKLTQHQTAASEARVQVESYRSLAKRLSVMPTENEFEKRVMGRLVMWLERKATDRSVEADLYEQRAEIIRSGLLAQERQAEIENLQKGS